MHLHLETCIFPILSLAHCRFVGLSSKLSDMVTNEETSATKYRIQFGTFHIANYTLNKSQTFDFNFIMEFIEHRGKTKYTKHKSNDHKSNMV